MGELKKDEKEQKTATYGDGGQEKGTGSASVRGAESPFPCEPRGCVNLADVPGLVTSVNQCAVKNRTTSWFIPESDSRGAC